MKMQVNIAINMCGECPYISHSGAFTPGGAKDVCAHKNAVSSFGAKAADCQHEATHKAGGFCHHWEHRTVKQYAAPPAGCPLRANENAAIADGAPVTSKKENKQHADGSIDAARLTTEKEKS